MEKQKIKLIEGKNTTEITREQLQEMLNKGEKIVFLEKESSDSGIPVYQKVKVLKG